MNIIFGDARKEIPDGYTVLELDTFRHAGQDQTITAYCVVEKVPLGEFATLENYRRIHEDLVKFYKNRHWDYCEHAIESLMGRWGHELDTFYSDLLKRVTEYKTNPPDESWDGTVVKSH
jgi:hypothetical protein